MQIERFEAFLDELRDSLTNIARNSGFDDSGTFETAVRSELHRLLLQVEIDADLSSTAQAFPDIVFENFGIEVKFTSKDTWRSIANSVFEGTRRQSVENIYVVFGKMGGEPEVRWRRYEEAVIHVRTSHVPRFELTLEEGERDSLFDIFGITYAEFSRLSIEQRMNYVREYAKRKHEGEHLWWFGAKPAEEQWSPTGLRLFTELTEEEKAAYRAEAALLFPQVVRSYARGKPNSGKYNDVIYYLLKRHSIVCSNARDMFTAGSALGQYEKSKPAGDPHIPWALKNVERQLLDAARNLEDSLFIEYWGESVPPEKRIERWLQKVDKESNDWRYSGWLFFGGPEA